jgi:hypothetical protein
VTAWNPAKFIYTQDILAIEEQTVSIHSQKQTNEEEEKSNHNDALQKVSHLKNTAVLNMKWEKQRGNTNRK